MTAETPEMPGAAGWVGHFETRLLNDAAVPMSGAEATQLAMEIANQSSQEELLRLAAAPEQLRSWAREWLRPKPPCAAWAHRILFRTLTDTEFTRVLHTCNLQQVSAWAAWLADQPDLGEWLCMYEGVVEQALERLEHDRNVRPLDELVGFTRVGAGVLTRVDSEATKRADCVAHSLLAHALPTDRSLGPVRVTIGDCDRLRAAAGVASKGALSFDDIGAMVDATSRGLMLLDLSQGAPHVYVRSPGPAALYALVLRVGSNHYEPIVHRGQCVLREHTDALRVMRTVANAPSLMPQHVRGRGDAPEALLVAEVGGCLGQIGPEQPNVSRRYCCGPQKTAIQHVVDNSAGTANISLTPESLVGDGFSTPCSVNTAAITVCIIFVLSTLSEAMRWPAHVACSVLSHFRASLVLGLLLLGTPIVVSIMTTVPMMEMLVIAATGACILPNYRVVYFDDGRCSSSFPAHWDSYCCKRQRIRSEIARINCQARRRHRQKLSRFWRGTDGGIAIFTSSWQVDLAKWQRRSLSELTAIDLKRERFTRMTIEFPRLNVRTEDLASGQSDPLRQVGGGPKRTATGQRVPGSGSNPNSHRSEWVEVYSKDGKQIHFKHKDSGWESDPILTEEFKKKTPSNISTMKNRFKQTASFKQKSAPEGEAHAPSEPIAKRAKTNKAEATLRVHLNQAAASGESLVRLREIDQRLHTSALLIP